MVVVSHSANKMNIKQKGYVTTDQYTTTEIILLLNQLWNYDHHEVLALRSLIMLALCSSTISTASARAVHVGVGWTCFNHSDSISNKQSCTPSSSAFILLRTCFSSPSNPPIIFQSVAKGMSSLNVSLSLGLPSNVITML